MKAIFDNVSASCSKVTTRAYSTSFSLGIQFLHTRLHKPIYNIYGFVRLADEIVDSFHNFDRRYLLQKLREDTIAALGSGISINPILNSFQETVAKYTIEWDLIDTFLKSMEMDLTRTEHNQTTYQQYILGSAEVVGLMCLKVFTNGNSQQFEELKPYAMKLGSAFQKVNFLRDINADYNILGRTYFPGVDFSSFSHREKEVIQREIEADFAQALTGIRKLPMDARRGVYMAYFYYRKLFLRIKQVPAEKVLNTRIRIHDLNKISLMFQSLLRNQLNAL